MKLPVCILLGLVPFTLSLGQSEKIANPHTDSESVKKWAAKIDVYLNTYYKRNSLPNPQIISDEKFLRRAYLVAIGRIPSLEETEVFLHANNRDKRQALIESLYQSKGYSSHMSNWAFDLLRVREKVPGTNKGDYSIFRYWVRKAIDANMPWDEMVEKLVDSHGNAWDPDEAAVGFYKMDQGMPLDQLANSMRIFLGNRMECAQCHDDPFGDTTQKDFYHLAAFTDGQSIKQQDLFRKIKGKKELLGNDIRRALKFNVLDMAMDQGGNGRIQLPADYRYKDGEPTEWIGAQTPFGQSVTMSATEDAQDGRKKFADWIIRGTEEQFAAVIANRMWQRVMGQGIYEPVDEYIAAKDTIHPELMSFLTRLIHEMGYDLRAFQNTLMQTQFFQFETNKKPDEVNPSGDLLGRKIMRLSAEQVWDSILTLIVDQPDQLPIRSANSSYSRSMTEAFGNRVSPLDFAERVLATNSAQELKNYLSGLSESKESSIESQNQQDSMMGMRGGEKRKKMNLQRASELPSPAPGNHFLVQFGASDRSIVEDASREPNISQVLTLMNGIVQNGVIYNPSAKINQSLKEERLDFKKIEKIYLSILNRIPREKEMNWMKKESGEMGYENIIASLLMSSEFLYLQ